MVKIDKSVDVPFENGQMVHGGSSAIAVYNTDQKSIISKFKEADDFEKDALYLFFVDNVKGKTGDVAGFMPLQRQAGFIYDSPNLFVVAHELAHGAFNLRHTFSPEEFIAAERTTKNLMDYTGDTELWQSQWGLIHDPENMLFAWAQDEGEGEFSVEIHEEILEYCIKQTGLSLNNELIEELITGVRDADLKGYNDEKLHFDNKFNFTDIKTGWNTINALIKPLNINKKEDAYLIGKYLHAVMDFYAHSNYVELYISYWYNTGNDLSKLNYVESPPIYDDAIKETGFLQNYAKYLITGHFNIENWLNPFVSDQEIANSAGHIHHDLLNKDAPGKGRSDLQIVGTTNTLYHFGYNRQNGCTF